MLKGNLFLLSFVALLVSLFGSVSMAAVPYDLDKVHSSIDFRVSHLMISKTNGTFNDFSGEFVFDKDDLEGSYFNVEIDVASIDTRNEARDKHLRAEDFFAADKYPKIVFRSKKVVAQPDGTYLFVGDLTMKDVTKEVEWPVQVLGPVTIPSGGQALGVEASFVVNRQEYGVTWNKVLDNGGVMVGNLVEVNVNLELNKQ